MGRTGTGATGSRSTREVLEDQRATATHRVPAWLFHQGFGFAAAIM